MQTKQTPDPDPPSAPSDGFKPASINDRRVAVPGVLDPPTANLSQVFAGCVLVAVPRGANPEHVPVPLAPETGTPGYLSRLAISNIAVNLGPRSAGLAAIRFTDRAELDAFLKRNPTIQLSLITENAAGPVIWAKAQTVYRLPFDAPALSVRMTGNLLVFDRGDVRRADALLNHATPTMVDLQELDWGNDLNGHIDVWLTRLQHGDFFHRTKRGRTVPKPAAWRHLLARQLRRRIAYECREHEYYEATPNGEWRPLAETHLRDLLQERIAAAPVEPAGLKSLLNDEFLERLIRWLRTSLAAKLPVAEARLRVFAVENLSRETGANVTSAELYHAFVEDHRRRGRRLIPATTFRRMIGRVLAEEPWRLSKSNSVPRESGHQHGYRGVRLKGVLDGKTRNSDITGTLGMKSRAGKCTLQSIPAGPAASQMKCLAYEY